MKIYFVATFTTFALLSNSSAQGQGKSARLEVSEKACPFEVISVPTAVQLPDGVTVLVFDATVRKPIPFAKWTTGDIAPKPNQLALLWVGISRSTGPVSLPTVSGAGIKWKLEKTLDVNGGPRRLCLFSGISTTPAKGALTIDFNGQKQQRAFWAAIQFRDASSVRQVGIAPDSTARDGSGEVIFASPPIGPVAAFVMGSIRSDIVPPSGMFELGELYAVHRIEAAYSPKPLKQIQWTWQRGVHYLAIGAELMRGKAGSRNGRSRNGVRFFRITKRVQGVKHVSDN